MPVSRSAPRAVPAASRSSAAPPACRARPEPRQAALVALAIVALVTLSSIAAPATGQGPPGRLRPAEGQVLATAVHALQQDGPTTTSDRVVLLEMFTATWCPPCGPADRAVDRLLSERSPALDEAAWTNGSAGQGALELAVLEYHPFPDLGGEDPFGIPEGNDRMVRKYDAFWFPSVYVDGTLEDAPDDRSNTVDVGLEEISYDTYDRMIQEAAAIPSPFVLGLDALAVPDADGGAPRVDVTATVQAKLPIAGAVFVQAVVWEDHVRFAGSNGVDEHRMTVRAIGPRTTVPVVEAGTALGFDWRVPVPAEANLSRAGVTLLVEAAWGNHEPDPLPDRMMAFAGGVAMLAATAVFVSLRTRRRPMGHAKDNGPGDDGPSAPSDDDAVDAPGGGQA